MAKRNIQPNKLKISKLKSVQGIFMTSNCSWTWGLCFSIKSFGPRAGLLAMDQVCIYGGQHVQHASQVYLEFVD